MDLSLFYKSLQIKTAQALETENVPLNASNK